MKHFTKLVILTAALISAQSLFAQELYYSRKSSIVENEWHFGPTLGYENTSVNLKLEGNDVTMDRLSGFNLGGIAEYCPIRYFGIYSGLSFVMNGYWMKGWYEGTVAGIYYRGNIEVKTNLYYFMFPLVLEGKIPLNDECSLNIECGPEFYVGLDSKTTTTFRTSIPGYGEDYATSHYKGIFDQSLSRFNCDIHLAGGFQYSGFRLLAGYNFGVYNMLIDGATISDSSGKTYKVNKQNGDSFTMSGFFINIAYLF